MMAVLTTPSQSLSVLASPAARQHFRTTSVSTREMLSQISVSKSIDMHDYNLGEEEERGREREGGREREREGEREGGREGERERGREGGRDRIREEKYKVMLQLFLCCV